MRSGPLLCMLVGMLVFQYPLSTSAQVVIVETSPGETVITNSPAIASSGRQLKKINQKAEGYIFPVEGARRRQTGHVERILTGIFSSVGQTVDVPPDNELPDVVGFESELQKKTTAKKDENSIAWITNGGLTYHDLFLECATGSERIWVSSDHDLVGLQPCQECFHKNNNVPAFINKEFGALDVATAATLLDNAAFLIWAQERLPLRNPGFISSEKLMIYPKMEMTKKGLHQLARETELAYRRKTWKVIEVIGKLSETDVNSVSSFDTDVKEGND